MHPGNLFRHNLRKGLILVGVQNSQAMALSRAKAEAAAAKLQYVELEAGLKKKEAQLIEEEHLSKASAARKKAELHADLTLLNEKKEIAAAAAEALSLEKEEGDGSLFKTAENPSLIDTAARINAYVIQQAEYNAQQTGFNSTHEI